MSIIRGSIPQNTLHERLSMSEAQGESRRVFPFQKIPHIPNKEIMPDSDSAPIYPFTKTVGEAANEVEKELEELDPKDEGSAPESVPSLTSPTTSEQIESGAIVPGPVDKETGPDKETENSSQPSSDQTSPGWTEPPAPAKPPTKG